MSGSESDTAAARTRFVAWWADTLAKAIDDRIFRTHILNNPAVAEADQGNVGVALDLASRAMALRQQRGDLFGEAVIQTNMGEWLVEEGLLDEASEQLSHAARTFERGYPPWPPSSSSSSSL